MSPGNVSIVYLFLCALLPCLCFSGSALAGKVKPSDTTTTTTTTGPVPAVISPGGHFELEKPTNATAVNVTVSTNATKPHAFTSNFPRKNPSSKTKTVSQANLPASPFKAKGQPKVVTDQTPLNRNRRFFGGMYGGYGLGGLGLGGLGFGGLGYGGLGYGGLGYGGLGFGGLGGFGGFGGLGFGGLGLGGGIVDSVSVTDMYIG